ncbi:MAG: hypothetical protein HZA81_00105 [Candidatus Taylorbacteria bacterium]|nr:hypothetical protein [Candidatus Taylorbacteria bacterium]
MIELTTSLVMLASAFLPAVDMTKAGKTDAISTSATSTVAQAIPGDQFLPIVSVEAYVREYFKDAPILAEIARCESTFRQFDSKGNVIRGKVNSGDIGIMQINKYYHEESAEKLGYDIYSIDGNLGFAKWLYGKYGDAPWVHSSKCWSKYKEIAKI